MVWLPDGEKNIEDMFIRFDKIHQLAKCNTLRCDGPPSQLSVLHLAAESFTLHSTRWS